MAGDQERLAANPGEALRRPTQQLEERGAELTRQLEAAARDLETFSYSLSHDLRAPLRAIDNYSGILDKEYGGKLDAEGRRLITVVRKNATRMDELIKDMLAFARAGNRQLILADIDLEGLVRCVLQQLTPNVAGRQVDVRIHALPHVIADGGALRTVLLNLLANAIKFTRRRELARIEINAYLMRNEVICSVQDNGVGFEPEFAHKLFGIFQRLHDPEEFEGTGIGLSIVKRTIEQHGGRVWAEGAPALGATFYFSLPTGNDGRRLRA